MTGGKRPKSDGRMRHIGSWYWLPTEKPTIRPLAWPGSYGAGGTPVEMEVCGMSVEESLTHAKLKGIVEVIAVNTEGKSTTYRVQGE